MPSVEVVGTQVQNNHMRHLERHIHLADVQVTSLSCFLMAALAEPQSSLATEFSMTQIRLQLPLTMCRNKTTLENVKHLGRCVMEVL